MHVSQCHNTACFHPFCMRSQQNCTATRNETVPISIKQVIQEEKLNVTVFVKLMDSLITFWIKPAIASTLLERKDRGGKMGGKGHHNALYPARPQNIYLLKMLGGILGREKKMEIVSTIQPFSLVWGKIHKQTCLRQVSLGKTKLHPAARSYRGTNL